MPDPRDQELPRPDTPRRWWGRAAAAVVRVRSDLAVAALDTALVTLSVALVLVLRFDGAVPATFWEGARRFLPVAVAVTLVSNWRWGLYGQLWRHASIHEARRLLGSGVTIVTLLTGLVAVDRSVPLIVAIGGTALAAFLMSLVRFQSRLFSFRRTVAGGGMSVVVIGAGDAGASLVREMLRSPRAGFRPVAVLDEASDLHGRSFMGVRVCGGIHDLPAVVAATGAHLVVFAMTNAPQELVRTAAAAAERAGVPMKVVPGLRSAMNGPTSMRDLRDLQIEDLLGREQVVTDLQAVRAMLEGRRVLITGAGGSIGSEIARQVAAFAPERLVLLDHDETHLHDVANDLDHGASGKVVQVLADIRQRRQMLELFRRHQPEVVFHAAAHKHVPLLEDHPCEAVLTNVVGSANVIDAAVEVGVVRLVSISTDKAVYPSSVMGATKRLSEQLVLTRAPAASSWCAVRFGNVLGSRGSVVPTFMRQIEAGGPVTVTDERMTRFFMSIEEAVQLVLQAAALADGTTGGEVFMLDMGEPVRIIDLARRMIRLSGRPIGPTPDGTGIEIRITGVRPGEKLAEELVTVDEAEQPTGHPAVRRVITNLIAPDELDEGVERLADLARAWRDEDCAALLRELAGRHHPDERAALPHGARRLRPVAS